MTSAKQLRRRMHRNGHVRFCQGGWGSDASLDPTKWNHPCAYCQVKDVPLQVEHIHPRSKGGSNRVSNLGTYPTSLYVGCVNPV
ncbi:HNH endonuclease [Microseira sp. BLCC-F43]|jgi:5-methylcytosine-specific restriction endonuclease McrA|uniref:HNH endonuclease n=1 Tax=Microseira sp. BLCC-F43 TaxID=3153602 RepID=UPI0035B727B0